MRQQSIKEIKIDEMDKSQDEKPDDSFREPPRKRVSWGFSHIEVPMPSVDNIKVAL